jgi:hypothetical protein
VKPERSSLELNWVRRNNEREYWNHKLRRELEKVWRDQISDKKFRMVGENESEAELKPDEYNPQVWPYDNVIQMLI